MNTPKIDTSGNRALRSGWIWTLLTIALGMLPSHSWATDYYVKNGGNDGDTGLSDGSAWATLAKVNATTFSPGDTISFKCGSTWSGETLTVSSSGSATSGIIYGAYGTGNKPVFSNATAEGVVISGKSYITVQDIAISGSASDGVSCDAGTFYITLQRLDISNGGSNGIVAKEGGHIAVAHCTVSYVVANGIRFVGSSSNPIFCSSVDSCTIHDVTNNDGITIHQDALGNVAGAHFLLTNNIAYNCGEQGFDLTTGSYITLEDNTTYDNHSGAINCGHSASHITIRYHSSDNEPAAGTAQTIVIKCPYVTLEYSRLVGPTQHKPLIVIGDDDLNADHTVIRNNTLIYNCATDGDMLVIQSGATLGNLDVINNVFASRTGARGNLDFAESTLPPNHTGFTFDYNLYYQPGGAQWLVAGNGSSPFGLAGVQSNFVQELSSVEANPYFVDLGGGDYHLSGSSSPGFDAGTTWSGQSTDFDGTAVPQGLAPDIGAFESLGGSTVPGAPSSPQAASVNNSEIDVSWQDNSGDETGFEIDRALDSAFSSGLTTGSVGAGVTTYAATGLSGNTTYYFRVRAVNANGDSVNSTTANATTQPPIITFTSIAGDDRGILESSAGSGTGGSLVASGGSDLWVGDSSGDAQYRSILSFDTSALPPGATILSATIRMKRVALVGTNPFSWGGTCYVDVCTGGFSGNTAIQTSDFQASATATNVAQMSNAANDNDWSVGTVNATGIAAINFSGKTQFRVYFSTASNGNATDDYLKFNSGNANAGNRPELVIQYQ